MQAINEASIMNWFGCQEMKIELLGMPRRNKKIIFLVFPTENDKKI
jgi:hypothetical protein